ncbi:nucleotidyltransferase family protein [Mycetocola tolaasinivorans]|uniref:nucleotidyltransferase family protein n=1 Tax=Mycetocola tolaasinivorans TaxID=76635 RepID=UPI001603B1A3|nr:nucleotidyltransferase family protein [Mycetocola tolaasinivorans]
MHALVDDVSEVTGARYLVIKGASTTSHGLRPTGFSSDVDVLVSPADLDRFTTEVARRGWQLRPSDIDTGAFPQHSVTYFHAEWPCDLDVHFRFPGLEGDAEEVFDALYFRRSHLNMIGRSIAHPGLVDALTIAVLHCLRSPGLQRQESEYRALVRQATRFDSTVLVDQARSVGALACIAPYLREAYGLALPAGTPPASEEWILRTTLTSPNARRMALLMQAPMREKVHLMRLAIAPTSSTLLKNDIHARPTLPRLLLALLRRWVRGPARALRGVRQARAFVSSTRSVDELH